jgi:hypothetical protein
MTSTSPNIDSQINEMSLDKSVRKNFSLISHFNLFYSIKKIPISLDDEATATKSVTETPLIPIKATSKTVIIPIYVEYVIAKAQLMNH